MGNCVAGGGYLPVLCDKLLMTEGSGLYLAGPALVKSAIGQEVSHEELGGAAMHAADQRHDRLSRAGRRGVPRAAAAADRAGSARRSAARRRRFARQRAGRAGAAGERSLRPGRSRSAARTTKSATCWPASSMPAASTNTRPSIGQTLVCGTARIGGFPVGIVANQRHRVKSGRRRVPVRRRAVRRFAPRRPPAS